MLDLTLINAKTLGPDGWHHEPTHVCEGLICDQARRKSVDLSGYLLLPGCVDLHGDAFEKHIAPRRGAINNIGVGFPAIEAELAANGITTAYLAQFFSWEGGMRGPRFAYEFLAAHAMYRTLGTDMRVQLRFETRLLQEYHRVCDLVKRFEVTYVALNDHLPHDALAQGLRPARLTGQALRAGRSPEAQLALMQRLHEHSEDAVNAAIQELVRQLPSVRFASHDDETPKERTASHGLGLHIAEFPVTQETAQEARRLGDKVVMGAPNAMRGGSHNRNASTHDLVRHGLVDALASDYHYPSLRLGVKRLVQDGVCDLAHAWRLISTRPAHVMELTDRGEITPPKRADLVVCSPDDLKILATIAGGRITHLTGDAAERFICA